MRSGYQTLQIVISSKVVIHLVQVQKGIPMIIIVEIEQHRRNPNSIAIINQNSKIKIDSSRKIMYIAMSIKILVTTTLY